MTEQFLDIVNMSISASWLVLAVLALRLVLKKAPKWVNVLLWGMVAVKLVCPVSFESNFSLIPEFVSSGVLVSEWTDDYVGNNHFIHENSEYYHNAVKAGREPIPDGTGGYYVATGEDRVSEPSTVENTVVPVLALVWLAGMGLMAMYTIFSYFSLRKKLATAVRYQNNIYQCEMVHSPFVLGILKPRIYLPYAMDDQNLNHVIAHEQAHIRRKDHWWKPLGFLLLTIHWFNPLIWVAYILLCRDIELACDEKVIAELGNEQRADYSQALVDCAVNRHLIAACPLAFGEVGVKERVKSILNYRKPTFWIIVTALVVCVAVAVCFLTDPTPSREFSMTGNHVFDLDPEAIVDRILDIEDIDNSGVYVNSNNFTLTVDGNFNWVDSQTIRYFFWDHQEIRSAQLRIFPNEDEFNITESSEWVEQKYRYHLQHYLEALKNLPQDAIRQIAPADRYLIEHIDKGRPSDYDRLITYSSEGVCEIDGWFIHLRILPLHDDGEGYSGTGDETVDLFYGQEDKSFAGYIKLDDSMKYYLTIPSDNVYRIEVVTENSSGGSINADESCFKEGERVYLEQLDGIEDLRGVSVVAYDRQGVILNVISIPKSEYGVAVNAIEEHGWFLAPDGVDIGMLNISEPVYSESTKMIPTDTELEGLHAGALLLPIDGNIYRYLISVFEPEGVTVNELLFEFEEPDLNGTIHWEVYSLQEYPDYLNVMVLSDRGDAWICCYLPPSACADTALEDAMRAGYVVMEDGIATHGQDTWQEFYNLTQQGKPASVTVAHYSTLNPERCDEAYYETFQQDYPFLSLIDLSFDGNTFTLTFKDSDKVHTRTYEYLRRYGIPNYAATSPKELAGYFEYVLTHDNKVTWEQLFNGLTSSQAGVYIDHFSIYAERKQ